MGMYVDVLVQWAGEMEWLESDWAWHVHIPEHQA